MNTQDYNSTPNAPISLSEIQIKLIIGEQVVEATARPILRLLPSPRLEFEFCHSPSAGPVWGDIGPRIILLHYSLTLEVYASRFSCGPDGMTGVLVPRRQACRIHLRPRRRGHTLRFGVLNFPPFSGRQDRTIKLGKRGARRIGTVHLEASPWKTEITEAHNLRDVEQQLRQEGGYTITHAGVVQRIDGRTFSAEEADSLLDVLRLFLSFARGGFCCPILPKALARNGDDVWEQWGIGPVLSWCYTPSCFDSMHGHILSEVFPGFWDCLHDPQWADAVRSALYWYLRSNAHGQGAGVDGGLILTQAALERLVYADLGKAKGNAAKRFTAALKARGISTDIPQNCQKLRTLAARNGWQDGPAAVCGVRNQLVHPDRRGESVSGSYFEAWDLAQRYVELMLLSLCRHSGLYADRVTGEWRGQVVKVPWA